MAQSTNMNSANLTPLSRPSTLGPDQPVASQSRSIANAQASLTTSNNPAASRLHESTSSHLTDGSQRYNLRYASQIQAQNVATTTTTPQPATNAVQVHNDSVQNDDGLPASAFDGRAQTDLRVIQERVARNNGSTHEDIEAAQKMLVIARRAEAAEQELAQRRGWRRG